jgi:hypothetical protein
MVPLQLTSTYRAAAILKGGKDLTMKITVITDAQGKILGTARMMPGQSKDAPTFRFRERPGRTLHEIELPRELEGIQSAEDLHRELAKLIKHK